VALCYALIGASFAMLIADGGISETLDFVFGDPTLTGRDQIWAFTWERFHANPALGVGYGALWQIGPEIVEWSRRRDLFFVFNQAHNGYLDVLAQLGWFGTSITMVCLLFMLRRLLALSSVRFYQSAEMSLYSSSKQFPNANGARETMRVGSWRGSGNISHEFLKWS
jgi:O-antigen ligase